MDTSQNYYATLGVPPGASTEDIKAAYRMAARRFHPDVNPNDGAAIQFRDIAAAYEVLGDETQRRRYDDARERLEVDPQFITVQVTPSKRILPLLGEPQVVYVLLQVAANRDFHPGNRKHAPLNLALVLDRSKSMRGARLDRVKVAAHQIIDQLEDTDYLSIISFSDRAEALIQSSPASKKTSMKAMVNTMVADGGTEIFRALDEAMRQVKKNADSNFVNHIVLLTDGETYDDPNLSLELADTAVQKGIGISTMGIGHEWNDVFLDELASRTGGSSAYVNSPGAVVRFLNDRVRSLGSSYAERVHVSIAPDPDIQLESVFKLMPNPQPVDIAKQPLQLGTLENSRPITLLIQFQMSAKLQEGFRTMLRLDVTGDVLHEKRMNYKVISDLSIEVAQNPPIEDPPRAILDALGKLTLYRMQQKAEAAIQSGNFDEATRRLENLATRLLAAGQENLAATAMLEAKRIKSTHVLSEEGRKTMKFGTRMLLLSPGEDNKS